MSTSESPLGRKDSRMRRLLAFGEESMRGLDKDSVIDVSRFDLLS
jgi:hypothetical protein